MAAGTTWRRAGWVLALLAVVLAVLALRYVAEPMRVSGDSMAPTYRSGNEVLVWKGLRARSPDRGEVVVLRPPGSVALVVKRVAAVTGDEVEIRDGVLYVNDAAVREGYLDHARVDGTYFGPVVVGAGAIFVLGDNRSDSIDSRDYGTVEHDRVVGMVRRRLWR